MQGEEGGGTHWARGLSQLGWAEGSLCHNLCIDIESMVQKTA